MQDDPHRLFVHLPFNQKVHSYRLCQIAPLLYVLLFALVHNSHHVMPMWLQNVFFVVFGICFCALIFGLFAKNPPCLIPLIIATMILLVYLAIRTAMLFGALLFNDSEIAVYFKNEEEHLINSTIFFVAFWDMSIERDMLVGCITILILVYVLDGLFKCLSYLYTFYEEKPQPPSPPTVVTIAP